MQADTITLQNNNMSPPNSAAIVSNVSSGNSTGRTSTASKAATTGQTGNTNGNFPPPKTDKPRPHVCGTCSRSFARLEHLKRHERSHTKEKPFECPECTRCFARRDLLLRHQQKLHMTTTPSSRPRNNSRRESTSGGGPGRVRKNSVANGGNVGMRPRANTISHVDNTTLGLLAAANSSQARSRLPSHNHHNSLNSLPGPAGYEYRGISTGHHGPAHGLPRLETSGLPLDMSGGLRTAPAFGGFSNDFGMDHMMFGPGTTINPAQLHFSGSPQGFGMDTPASPYHQAFPGMSASQAMLEEENNFDWVNGFDSHMSFAHANESAIDGSSPSAMSTNSHSGMSEVMLDGSHNAAATTSSVWPNALAVHSQMVPTDFPIDFPHASYPEIMPAPVDTISPKSLLSQNGYMDSSFATPPPLAAMSPMHGVPGAHNTVFNQPMVANTDTPTASSASVASSLRQSSVTSASTDSVTDATRQAILASLSHPIGQAQRRFSQASLNSPLSPDFASRSRSFNAPSLPSTYDLQRYVSAYIQYFHPHLPFLHIASLSFDSPTYTSNTNAGGHSYLGTSGIAGGGGCLVLAMAAIGALYEFDLGISKELFEAAKKMIQLYLEERRKADVSAALNGAHSVHENSLQNTPLWLVQAMLLNVIYGHNCGDKTAAEIALTHCGALVSLARAAELPRPVHSEMLGMDNPSSQTMAGDIHMNGAPPETWNSMNGDMADDNREWLSWKVHEERKRTLYAVFILSSLLVSAYNHAPALTNSEIRLDLPCDEALWAAENAQAWRTMGGAAAAEQQSISFATALSTLLTASQRQQYQGMVPQSHRPFGSTAKSEDLPESELKPSTFGCLVLINALHNYIWETRQRHLGRQWTTQETEAMHAHIEPALRAWQAAWFSSPQHSLERPNPFGMGPLSADSIPLLDLAYVRLFVNLGRSKEAFWQRDWDAMAEELARGAEIVQHADFSPDSEVSNSDQAETSHSAHSRRSSMVGMSGADITLMKTPTQEQPTAAKSAQSSKRERHLRKAAFYAADSLSMSDKLGITFAEFTSRELPLQCAMCAFDCAQVLAEWVATVQERVGRYLGVLGKDEIEYGVVPGIMLLEDEDCKLLEKVGELLRSAEYKMSCEVNSLGTMAAASTLNGLASNGGGYGSKILLVTAHVLERAAVWPVTKLMARSLETQAMHMIDRADRSVRISA